jgi:hypothetical protein
MSSPPINITSSWQQQAEHEAQVMVVVTVAVALSLCGFILRIFAHQYRHHGKQ